MKRKIFYTVAACSTAIGCDKCDKDQKNSQANSANSDKNQTLESLDPNQKLQLQGPNKPNNDLQGPNSQDNTTLNPNLQNNNSQIQSNSPQNSNKLAGANPGLQNAGNSCFLNVVMQVLFTICQRQNVKIPKKTQIPDEQVSDNVWDILQNMKNSSDSTSISIAEQQRVIRQELFNDTSLQQDAHELLIKIFDKIPALQQLVKFSFNEKLNCSQCNSSLIKNEVHSILVVNIGEGQTKLEDMLNQLFVPESVDCSECKTQNSYTKTSKIKSLGNILPIQLERSSFDKDKGNIKLENSVEFPENLTMQPQWFDDENATEQNYKLIAVICHSGSAQSGHYWAYCKSKNEHGEKWFSYSDSEVKAAPDRITGVDSVGKDTCLLFYEKKV